LAIYLPDAALALTFLDRRAFYSRLITGNGPYVTDSGLLIAVKARQVKSLLSSAELTSERLETSPLPKAIYDQWLMYREGAVHLHCRRLLAKALSSSEGAMVQDFQPVAESCCTILRDNSEVDLIRQVISPFIEQCLSMVTGLNLAVFRKARHAAEPIVAMVHGMSNLGPHSEIEGAWSDVTDEINADLRLRASPGLISHLREIEGEGVSTGMALLPIFDVYEPLCSLCADTVLALIETEGRVLPGTVVDETLRLCSPFQVCTRRVADPSVEYLPLDVSVGQRVALVIAAANLDSDLFAEPDKIRKREGGAHFAFGRGRHSCIGASLTYSILKVWAEVVHRHVNQGWRARSSSLVRNESLTTSLTAGLVLERVM